MIRVYPGSARQGRAARRKTARAHAPWGSKNGDKLRYPLPALITDEHLGQITTAVRQVPGVGLVGLDLANRSMVVIGHRLDRSGGHAAMTGVADGSNPLPVAVEILLVLGLELLRLPLQAPEV